MLTNHFVKCAVSDLQEVIDAPERELSVWVQQNAKYFVDIQEFYPECNDCPESFYVLDTQDRDTLFDVVGLYFVNDRWPRNYEGPEIFEDFETKLKQQLELYNWKLKGEEVYATSTQVELRQGAA